MSVTARDAVIPNEARFAGAFATVRGYASRVIPPLPVAGNSRYHAGPSEHTRIFGAKPQRAGPRVRGAGWSA